MFNFLKLFAICSPRSSLKVLLNNYNGGFFVQWNPKKYVMSVIDFCFQNADTKGKNLGHVFWLGMVMSTLIHATLLRLWETLWPMSNKVDFMKFLQSIMTWYMKLLALSYPLQWYINLLVLSYPLKHAKGLVT